MRSISKILHGLYGCLRFNGTGLSFRVRPQARAQCRQSANRNTSLGIDPMTLASHASVMERDLRLDFFRGLALFCIFLDHLPNNFLAQFTLQSVMFADAAEVFILISGYTTGMVYGRALERQGFLVAGVRVYHRVWQLYVAHIFLFMIFLAMVAHTEGALNKSLYAEEFGATNFLSEPGLALF